MAWSATRVLPAPVGAATSTDSPRSIAAAARRWNGSSWSNGGSLSGGGAPPGPRLGGDGGGAEQGRECSGSHNRLHVVTPPLRTRWSRGSIVPPGAARNRIVSSVLDDVLVLRLDPDLPLPAYARP